MTSVMLSISRDRDETHPDHLRVYILYSRFIATKFCKEKKIIFGLGRTYSTVDELKQFQLPLFWDPNIYTPRSMA